jgi:hypothetical protein
LGEETQQGNCVGLIGIAVLLILTAVWTAFFLPPVKPQQENIANRPIKRQLNLTLDPKYVWERFGGITVESGDLLTVTASGEVVWSKPELDKFYKVGPRGTPYNADTLPSAQETDDKYQFPMLHAPVGALIMRIGKFGAYQTYYVGEKLELKIPDGQGGHLEFAVNKWKGWMLNNEGSFQLHVEIR